MLSGDWLFLRWADKDKCYAQGHEERPQLFSYCQKLAEKQPGKCGRPHWLQIEGQRGFS